VGILVSGRGERI